MRMLLRAWLWIVVAAFGVDLAHGQPLPTHPELTTGQLDNGLTYIIRKHDNPPGRAAVWMHLHTGSLNETDQQRGLAHYLEHLAFNGSDNFPPGSVVPFFQSLGMTFGRDQNAFTGFDQTTYVLSLPNVEPETLNKGMMFFADVLDRLLLLPKEIESERQIIQEERRRSLSGRQRTMYALLERMAPGSLYGLRIPIGTEETIDAVREPDFRDYYERWYTASNATLMVVADAEPAAVLEVIREQFGKLPGGPRPEPQEVGVKAYSESFAIVTSDPEVQSEEVRIMHIEPPRPPVTTVPTLREELTGLLAQLAFNRRLERKVAAGGTSYLSASVSLDTDARALYMADLNGRAAAGKWQQALEELALELQRARKFGFSEREVEDAKKEVMAYEQRNVETEDTRPASELLQRMNDSVASGDTILSPEQELELVEQLMPQIDAAQVSEVLRKDFDPKAVAFVATLPAGPDVPTESELLEIGRRAMEVEPSPEDLASGATQLMEQLPTAGKVVDSTVHEATQIWSGWLSNNVRVHHRLVDSEKNQVTVNISLIGGELHETEDTRGRTRMAVVPWLRPATRHLSSSDIQDLMTGKKISVQGGGTPGGSVLAGNEEDAIALTITGSPDDLEAGFQLAHLLLTEPKVEEAAFNQMKTLVHQAILTYAQNPLGTGMRLMSALPMPPSVARTQPLTAEQLERVTPEAAQQWLDRLIAESPVEVAIVGDVPRERAIELAAKYVGSIPERPRVSASLYQDLRSLPRPEMPRALSESIVTTTPQAFVMSAFYGPDETNVADTRAMTMATRILSTRMVKEVREEAQLVYSISASLIPGSTYPGFGIVFAAAPTQPGKEQALIEKVASMYAAVAKDGVTDEELTVAKKQIANALQEQFLEPDYWLNRLEKATFRGIDFDEIMRAPQAYEAITRDQVREIFARYYDSQQILTLVVSPKSE